MAPRRRSAFGMLPDAAKPRERFIDSTDQSKLSDADVLAILLKTGCAGCDVATAARRLLGAFGTVSEMVRSDYRTLETRVREYNAENPGAPVRGVGRVKLVELAAAFELVRRGYEKKPDDLRKMKIETPEDACRIFCSTQLGWDEQENFLVLPLNAKNLPMSTEPVRITRGTTSGAPVHPREGFKQAIRWSARSIFIAHNHPSGDPEPSKDDIRLTERLLEASRIIGIPIVDHIILGEKRPDGSFDFVSLRREGLVDFG